MPKFEDNILGFIPKDEWLDVGFDVSRPNDPIDGLFGDIRTANLVAKWEAIASEYNVPLMAQFHGFDTESQKTFRIPVDTKNIEKGLIKVKINQSERMRALLRAGVQNDELYDYVLNDGIRLADQVVTRSKVAKNELLATGKVTIKENGLDLTVDYGVPASNTSITINVAKDADIPGQIEGIIAKALEKGVTLNGLVTSRKMLNAIRDNVAVQKAINGTAMVGVLVSRAALENYLSTEFGLNAVVINDQTYGIPGEEVDGRPHVVAKRYYPEDKISFFATNPGGKLGDGLWGDPPETDVANLIDVNGSSESPYVYITQWSEKDPAVLWTKASALFMPVLYVPDSLWIATGNFVGGSDLTVSPLPNTVDLWGQTSDDLQTGIFVGEDKIVGTLKYVSTGTLATDWGAGNFLALKYSGSALTTAKHIYAGVDPSAGTGLMDILPDPDKATVTKITSKDAQKFKVIIDYGAYTEVKEYDLSGLTCNNA